MVGRPWRRTEEDVLFQAFDAAVIAKEQRA
jgi:hypothetical protein